MYPIFIAIPASLSCITFSKVQDSGLRIPGSGKQQSAILLFKCIRNLGPKYNRDFLSIRETSYNLRGNGVILCVSKFNLNFVRNSFTYKCAQLWNKLPKDVKLADNVNIFKSKLSRTFYIFNFFLFWNFYNFLYSCVHRL